MLTEELKRHLLNIALKSVPFEMCGILCRSGKTGEVYFKETPNVHETPKTHFRIHARNVAAVSIAGDSILAYVHSHPDGSATPTDIDVVEMNIQNKPYIIVGCASKTVEIWYPTIVPLLGRPYVHGKQDCYTLVRDYYQRECGIALPDFEREDLWWNDRNHAPLYADNFKAAGFVEISREEIQKHDVLLCYWGDTVHVNHALIYLGSNGELKSEKTEDCVGTRLFLHHAYNGLSTRCILGESRLSTCVYFLRHRQLL